MPGESFEKARPYGILQEGKERRYCSVGPVVEMRVRRSVHHPVA